MGDSSCTASGNTFLFRRGSSPRRQESRPALGRGYGGSFGKPVEGQGQGHGEAQAGGEPMSLELGEPKFIYTPHPWDSRAQPGR